MRMSRGIIEQIVRDHLSSLKNGAPESQSEGLAHHNIRAMDVKTTINKMGRSGLGVTGAGGYTEHYRTVEQYIKEEGLKEKYGNVPFEQINVAYFANVINTLDKKMAEKVKNVIGETVQFIIQHFKNKEREDSQPDDGAEAEEVESEEIGSGYGAEPGASIGAAAAHALRQPRKGWAQKYFGWGDPEGKRKPGEISFFEGKGNHVLSEGPPADPAHLAAVRRSMGMPGIPGIEVTSGETEVPTAEPIPYGVGEKSALCSLVHLSIAMELVMNYETFREQENVYDFYNKSLESHAKEMGLDCPFRATMRMRESMTIERKMPLLKEGLDLTQLKDMLKQFYPFARERIGFNKPVSVNLRSDQANADELLGKTAFYDPEQFSITLYTTGRHPKDIMRSFSHELVHHGQNCRGDLSGANIGEQGYAQNDEHLREMEREAYEHGNMNFRDWEDGVKSGGEQMSVGGEQISLEETIRDAINGVLDEQEPKGPIGAGLGTPTQTAAAKAKPTPERDDPMKQHSAGSSEADVPTPAPAKTSAATSTFGSESKPAATAAAPAAKPAKASVVGDYSPDRVSSVNPRGGRGNQAFWEKDAADSAAKKAAPAAKVSPDEQAAARVAKAGADYHARNPDGSRKGDGSISVADARAAGRFNKAKKAKKAAAVEKKAAAERSIGSISIKDAQAADRAKKARAAGEAVSFADAAAAKRVDDAGAAYHAHRAKKAKRTERVSETIRNAINSVLKTENKNQNRGARQMSIDKNKLKEAVRIAINGVLGEQWAPGEQAGEPIEKAPSGEVGGHSDPEKGAVYGHSAPETQVTPGAAEDLLPAKAMGSFKKLSPGEVKQAQYDKYDGTKRTSKGTGFWHQDEQEGIYTTPDKPGKYFRTPRFPGEEGYGGRHKGMVSVTPRKKTPGRGSGTPPSMNPLTVRKGVPSMSDLGMGRGLEEAVRIAIASVLSEQDYGQLIDETGGACIPGRGACPGGSGGPAGATSSADGTHDKPVPGKDTTEEDPGAAKRKRQELDLHEKSLEETIRNAINSILGEGDFNPKIASVEKRVAHRSAAPMGKIGTGVDPDEQAGYQAPLAWATAGKGGKQFGRKAAAAITDVTQDRKLGALQDLESTDPTGKDLDEIKAPEGPKGPGKTKPKTIPTPKLPKPGPVDTGDKEEVPVVDPAEQDKQDESIDNDEWYQGTLYERLVKKWTK